MDDLRRVTNVYFEAAEVLVSPIGQGIADVIREVRGDPRLKAGEESDPCGAGQG